MATTSVWRVNGWLGKVLIYIENPDKTENPDFFEKQDMGGKETQGLADVIEYAVQQQKTSKAVENEGETVMRQFVSGVRKKTLFFMGQPPSKWVGNNSRIDPRITSL